MGNRHPICLCQNTLKEYTVDPGDICRNCCRELSPNHHGSIYICLKDNCFYDRIANQSYFICDECYNTNDGINNGNNNMDQIDFICNKLLSSMNTISYVF